MPDAKGKQKDEASPPRPPPMRRGAISVESKAEYAKLQRCVNEKDKLVQYKPKEGDKKTEG